jgi:hypothetical protein
MAVQKVRLFLKYFNLNRFSVTVTLFIWEVGRSWNSERVSLACKCCAVHKYVINGTGGTPCSV